MKNYLLLVSVGPIQDFIASARRSRDLWFGSWLLSELAKTAARTIVEQPGSTIERLIFPAPGSLQALDPDSSFNVANKILAMVQVPEPSASEALETLGTTVKAAIDARLEAIRNKAFAEVRGKFNRDHAEAQVADLVEYYWVALPLVSEKGTDYQNTRRELEALMAARKITRSFAPVGWGGPVSKSSLDGLRESVIPEGVYPKQRDTDEEQDCKARELYQNYGARPGEHLSGVDLLKRLGKRGSGDSRFLSIPHVAALPFLARLERYQDDMAKEAWECYAKSLEQLESERKEIAPTFPEHPLIGHADGAIFFEEQFHELLGGKPPEDYLKSVRGELRTFLRATVWREGREVRPQPYYAVLLADGDRMGRAIDHQQSADQHRELSKALAKFAGEVQGIVENKGKYELKTDGCKEEKETRKGHEGALIYAGGDDVLALMPLHTVLECARALAQAFEKHLAGFADEEGNTPTLSVGVAVAHYLEPMSDALDLARNAEKEAKKTRNALAVIVSKRSGADRTVAGVWGTLDQRLGQFIDFHRNEQIPDGAAYELHALATNHGDTLPTRALRAEAVRILKRKRTATGSELDEPVLEKLKERVEGVEKAEGLRQLADELIVARLFADAKDLAEGKSATHR